MKKILFSLLIICSITFSNDSVEKPSQLELFLFKVGFESLLKDIKQIKEKSNINSRDLDNLNKKIDYILTELTKDSSSFNFESNQVSVDEVDKLKKIISRLEEKVETLENGILNSEFKKMVQKKETLEKRSDIKNQYSNIESKLNQITASKAKNYSIQIGIYKQQKSINQRKEKLEKIVDKSDYTVNIKKCNTCRNKYLKKILIEGFDTKKEATLFMKDYKLQGAMVVKN